MTLLPTRSLLLFAICCFLLSSSLWGQTKNLQLNLPEVIVLAQKGAPDVLLAETRLVNSRWRYKFFEAGYKPQIILRSTLPSLDRSISAITLPDGTDAFIKRALMTNSVGISLSQPIQLTGGNIYASTGVRRIDIFKTTGQDGNISYLSSPVLIGFNQPIFAFNQLKWDKRIEPLRYEEASREYAEEMEGVAQEAARLFFDVLIAQLNVVAEEKNKSNADTLLKISEGRFSVGRIAETDLLQIELSARQADAALAEAILSSQSSTEQLRNFLGITEAVNFDLEAPLDIPNFEIDLETALEQARKNRSDIIAFQRRRREAERDVAEAEAESSLSININGEFGLTQTASSFGDAYQNLLDQEMLMLNIEIPLADWGKARSRREIARSNQKLEQMNLEQEQVNFEREVILKVQQFDLVRRQVALGSRTFEVAQKREDITRKRYLIGKIGVTELNLAIRELNEARRSYYTALREFWLAHYDLRRLTLFDFQYNSSLFRALD
ncbi:MAG: TolC family protein [Bacteroidota bacterium]